MNDEANLLNAALSREKNSIQEAFKERTAHLKFQAYIAHFKYIIKRNSFTAFLLKIFRKLRYFNFGTQYSSIEDCYYDNVVENYKPNLRNEY